MMDSYAMLDDNKDYNNSFKIDRDEYYINTNDDEVTGATVACGLIGLALGGKILAPLTAIIGAYVASRDDGPFGAVARAASQMPATETKQKKNDTNECDDKNDKQQQRHDCDNNDAGDHYHEQQHYDKRDDKSSSPMGGYDDKPDRMIRDISKATMIDDDEEEYRKAYQRICDSRRWDLVSDNTKKDHFGDIIDLSTEKHYLEDSMQTINLKESMRDVKKDGRDDNNLCGGAGLMQCGMDF